MINKFFPAFRSAVTLGAVVSTALVITGCSGGGEEEAAAPGSPEAPADGGGTTASSGAGSGATADSIGITGMAKFEGEVPEPAKINTAGDAKCHSDITFSKIMVGEGGGLKDVFIKIKNPPEGDYAPPATPVILDQVGCMYTPHVMGIQTGQDLEVRNSDPTTHNVRAIARKNKPINMGQPAGSKPRVKTFKKEERMTIKCDIHKWMTAYVVAVSHPYFAVTDENGAFTIAGLPAGEYEYEAEHEAFKKQKGTITLDANGNGELNLTFAE
jgi:plastocyanin